MVKYTNGYTQHEELESFNKKITKWLLETTPNKQYTNTAIPILHHWVLIQKSFKTIIIKNSNSIVGGGDDGNGGRKYN
jgi:hypothetical protein